MAEQPVLLRAENLNKVYQSGEFSCAAVDHTSLEIVKGDFISIIGPSGSGKSSLLYLLAGFMEPDSGTIYWEGRSIWDMTKRQRARYRGREVGYVCQQSNMMDDLNILCNVSLPGYLYEQKGTVDKRSLLWLKLLGLDSHKNKFPKELSGGQKQKAAIARALINRPKLLLLDEPTGSLDLISGRQILEMLLLFNEKGQSIVMVTHDIGAAARGNKVLAIHDGRIDGVLELGKYDMDKRRERESMIYEMLEECKKKEMR